MTLTLHLSNSAFTPRGESGTTRQQYKDRPPPSPDPHDVTLSQRVSEWVTGKACASEHQHQHTKFQTGGGTQTHKQNIK